MSERKVLNKYYPPDFDPSKIPRLRLPKNRQYTVRIMAPCNMRCNTCADYIARGKKFNARKETVEQEDYLGLKVFRFYFKCPRCMQEITFKTDPKNYDYVVEAGATPNFKALKLAQQQAEEEQKEKEEEERLNPMKLLENRTKASRREMENLEALEDLKEMSQREVVINYEELFRKKKEEFEAEMRRQEEEDERLVQSIFHKDLDAIEEDGEEEEDEEEEEEEVVMKKTSKSKESLSASTTKPTDILTEESTSKPNGSSSKRKLLQGLVVVKKRTKEEEMGEGTSKAVASLASTSTPSTSSSSSSSKLPSSKLTPIPAALSSLCSYSDSDSNESD